VSRSSEDTFQPASSFLSRGSGGQNPQTLNGLFGGPRCGEIVNIHIVNPLLDNRWDDLVASHPKASAFHQRGWLEALARTYGYEPYVLTTAPADEPLHNGVVVCRVSSWITGTRLVSLPFSDHCEFLLDNPDQLPEFVNWLCAQCDFQRWRYVELRPISGPRAAGNSLQPSCSYWLHELDIRPSLEQIFQRFHNNSFRRKVQRAERERLSYESGQSDQLLDEFYRLLLLTRKRHKLLPQPRTWFRNLLECLGDKVHIRLARKNALPIAAMLTLKHQSCVVYKYGCSDERFHGLGGMPFLFWRLVEESRALGIEKIDFGRTDLSHEGLIAFKDRLGASKKLLTYYRYSKTDGRGVKALSDSQTVQQFFSRLPKVAFTTAGRLLYRHMG
jgi:CelD/BcsL family acetyltransferase involved in cellulose biosynthesis